ncbi:MAG: PAS domain S-box protein [Syntrophobacteraceae bacterium]|nr:PAS domain S-box protein [Syntrophobacteraceae bacterium]
MAFESKVREGDCKHSEDTHPGGFLPADIGKVLIEVLNLIKKDMPTHELLKEVVSVLADRTGLGAVGLRLKDGDDYPYFHARGLSDQFIRLENSLCPRGHSENPVQCEDNSVPLECVCGAVIQRKIDRTQAYFTEYGSFWSNNNTRLLNEHPQLRNVIRGNCVQAGYESSALIPLRLGEDTFGLLQFEDKRPDMLPMEFVSSLESIAVGLALALSQRQLIRKLTGEKELLETLVQQRSSDLFDSNVLLRRQIARMEKAQEALRDSEQKYRLFFDNAADAIFICDVEGKILAANEMACKHYGYTRSKMFSLTLAQIDAPEDIKQMPERIAGILELGELRFETNHVLKDGTIIAVEANAKKITWQGRPALLGICRDITERKRMEEDLRDSQKRLSLALKAARMGMFHWNVLTGESVWTDQYAAILGYPPSAGKHRYQDWIDRVHPDDLPWVRDRWHNAIASGSPYEADYRIVWPDNSLHWVAARGLCTRDGDGRVTHLLGSVCDITESKKAEHALRESEQRFRKLFENSPVAYQSLDIDGRYIDVNPELCNLLGYCADELRGKSFGEFWSDDTRACFLSTFENLKSNGQATGELTLKTKGGPLVSVILSGRIERDDNGRFLRSHCTLTDITRRKQAENEVNTQRETLTRMFESAPYIIMLVDKDGRVDNINHRGVAFAGKEKADLLGLRSGQIFDCSNSVKEPGCGKNPECGDCIIQNSLARAFNSGESVNDLEGRLVLRRQSRDVPIDIQLGSVLVKDSDADKVLVTITDITDRKRARQERERLQAQLLQSRKIEAIGRLAGGVAHDFNNMLGVIIGHTELALEEIKSDEPLYFDLQEIYKAGIRSADLTRQLLAFARKQAVEPRVLDINDTVSSMIKMLQRLLGEDIDLAWLPGHNVWKVKIDPSQIDQMLANLAVNARDAIKGVGQITIETSNVVLEESDGALYQECVPGDYVLLAVSDNGRGMSKNVLDHIFEPFFTTKDVGQGTGLGLATVYGIVKQNQGFIHVYSEPEKGTTFRICLPGLKGETGGGETESPAGKPPEGTETVLLVEDEQSILKLGKVILKRQGYSVLTAGKPSEAIRLVEQYPGDIQLLITDVIMPEMNGKELAERITSIKPGIRCLFMSGYTADIIARHSIIEEGVDFIQKPFSVRAMADKVREVLDR